MKGITITKEEENFKISENGKSLIAENFYLGKSSQVPKTAQEFEKGLKNGEIKFAKKGTKIALQGSKYKTGKDTKKCYYAVNSDERSYLSLGGSESFSSIPFEWQQ